MGQLGDYLAAHGRRMIGWDEILDGKVPANATVMSWRGTKGAIVAAQKGHDVVLSPAPDLYFDQLQSARADETTGRDAGEEPGRHLRVRAGAEGAHARAGHATCWARRRTCGPSTCRASRMWSTRCSRGWMRWPRSTGRRSRAVTGRSFLARLPAQFARYRAARIGYADSAFAAGYRYRRRCRTGRLAAPPSRWTTRHTTARCTTRWTAARPSLASPLYHGAVRGGRCRPPCARPRSPPDGSALAAPRTRVIDRADPAEPRTAARWSTARAAASACACSRLPTPRSLSPVYIAAACSTAASSGPPAPMDGIACAPRAAAAPAQQLRAGARGQAGGGASVQHAVRRAGGACRQLRRRDAGDAGPCPIRRRHRAALHVRCAPSSAMHRPPRPVLRDHRAHPRSAACV